VALLSRGLGRRDAGHGGDERFVVRHETELPTFKEKPEVPDGEECSKEFSIERRVPDLCRR
jgi:hypothetical protein